MSRREPPEFLRRQRATSPPDILRNDALFEGTLIKGGRPLTKVQRLGTLLIGLVFVSLPLAFFGILLGSHRHGEPLLDSIDRTNGTAATIAIWIVSAAITAAFGYVGWRMIKNATTAPKRN